MVGILVSFCDGPFSGAILVSGRVIPKKYRQLSLAKIERAQGIRYPQRGRRDKSGPLRDLWSLISPYGIKIGNQPIQNGGQLDFQGCV